ncbi:MAG: Crp/Fnr family transcriptional regulator [Bdellovibrio sp.]|nr:MAG: Crp/Fnr family transcriptional regulator [Bdellovibrio sp.]
MSAGGVKQLKKGEILFNEGDPSDAMYVIKSGLIAITKRKGNGEVELAELKAGEMLGEMAFFDNKPRSAGARAKTQATVIILPFKALHAQFQTFPEWLKAMVKTINAHLRAANQRIKNLEQAQSEDEEFFPPQLITTLCAIISLVGFKSGKKEEGGGLVIPQWTLRNYTIQIFKQPTHKMQRMMEVLSSLGLMKVEDLGEGKQKITILDHDKLTQFVDWYNEHLFKEERKRVDIEEKELPALKALVHFGRKETPDEKGFVTVSLTHIQENAVKELSQPFSVNDTDSLAQKGLVQEKQSGEGGVLTQKFNFKDLERLLGFWEIVHTLRKVRS